MLTALTILIVSLFVASGLMARQMSNQAPFHSSKGATLKEFSGMIAKVDENKKDIRVDLRKERMNFNLGRDVTITKTSGKCIEEAPLVDLKADSPFDWHWASVQYQKDGNKWVAERINVSRLW